MNFTVEKSQLASALKQVRKVLALNKDPKRVYANALKITATAGQLEFLGTDGETTYSYRVKQGMTVEAEGECGVVADKFLTAVDAISEPNLSFTYDAGLLNLRAGDEHVEFKTVATDEFPTLETVATPIRFPFDSTVEFRKILHTLGRDPSKRNMMGLCSKFKSEDGKTVTFYAVNPNKASRFTLPFESDDKVDTSIILPEDLADLSVELPLKAIGVSKSKLVANFGDFEVQTHLRDDKWINADVAFKSLDGKPVKFNRQLLLSKLKFVKAMCDKQDMKSKFTVSGDRTEISSYDEKSKVKSAVKSNAPDKVVFSANSEYLLAFLSALNTEDVELKVSDKLISYQEPNYQFVTTSYLTG